MIGRITALIARIRRIKIVRVLEHYGLARGPILAGGLAYQALFAVFAGLWAGFSIAGVVISADPVLRSSVLRVLRRAVPGLIDDGGGSGAIDPEVLLGATIYNISGTVALVGLIVIALGWLGSARDAVRVMFGLPGVRTNFVLRKLLDLALGLGFAALLLAAAALSFVGTSATRWLLDAVAIPPDSIAGTVVSRIVTLAVMLVLYALTLAAVFRWLSVLRIPARFLRQGVLLGALGLGALTALGTALLGGATNNPLIASFAVVAGLLIYFHLVCQVILVAASWIAVSLADAGVEIEPAPDASPPAAGAVGVPQ